MTSPIQDQVEPPVLTNSPAASQSGSPSNGHSATGSHAGASFFCEQLNARGFDTLSAPRILIAGCGSGHEAEAIRVAMRATVDAVDVEDFVEEKLRRESSVRFQVASVCDLPFDASTFDAIFYHHVIEHVDDPMGSIDELARVLKPKGWLFIGTPNRHRLLSSIGAHRQSQWEATLMNKLADNVRDWKDRLTGRFRNELGAHAGFSQGELDEMLAEHFGKRIWLTDQYLKFKYAEGRAAKLLPIATHPAICWFSAPSIYVLAQKG